MAAKAHDPNRFTELRNPKALRDYFIHDKFEAGVKLAKQFKLEAYPTLIMLDSNGREIRRQVGAFETPAALAQWMAKK